MAKEDRPTSQAKCSGLTELYFGEELDLRDEIGREEREEVAKQICATCSLRIACLQYALQHNEEFGIWGGMSQGDRRDFKIYLRKQGYKELPVGQELQANAILWTGSYGPRMRSVTSRSRARSDENRTQVSGRVVPSENGAPSDLTKRKKRKRAAS